MHGAIAANNLNHIHHTKNGFTNPWMNDEDYLRIRDRIQWRLQNFIVNPRPRSRRYSIPALDYRDIKIQERYNSTALTWVGHSTYLIQIDDVNILTDPVWSSLVGPGNKIGPRRKSNPGIPWHKLPNIDVVLISHTHYDHLDKPTVMRLRKEFNPLFIVPLGVKAELAKWNITNVQERDWWYSIKHNGIQFICTPAQHTSRRGLFDVDETLWSGWLISGQDETVYFAGDTGYFPEFQRVANHSPRQIDVAILPIGAYKPRWYMRYMHMDPYDALRAYRELNARYFAGMHWGAFDVADENIDEPPKELSRAANSFEISDNGLWMLALGETRIIT